jgi:hypothetical protein
VTVDGQARIITFVVDGVLNDGGAARQYGWGRIDPALGDVRRNKGVAHLRSRPDHVGIGWKFPGWELTAAD